MKRLFVLMGLGAVVLMMANAQAFRVTTADGNGADCELRESQPTSNKNGTELASRIDYVADEFGTQLSGKNSVMYLKFDVSTLTAADLAGDITVRMTYRNNNQIKTNRVIDDDGLDPLLPDTGMDYFVLDPTTAGADWDELTIAPTTVGDGLVQAPGYTYDGFYNTKPTDNAALTYLGFNQFDTSKFEPGTQSFSVGDAFDFTLGAGSALHDAIIAAQATAHQTLTIVVGCAHGGDAPSQADNDWTNFNYLFNPKEMTTLNDDPDSPWNGLLNDETTGYAFSPMLTNEPHIPEPATLVLLGLGGLFLRRKR